MRHPECHSFARRIRPITALALLTIMSACSSPPPPTTTTVTVTSIPGDAHIMIDGTIYGTTPVTITALAAGEHYVILEKADYKRLNKRFTVQDAVPLALELELIHDAGYITFKTRPKGAQIHIITQGSNTLFGETPLDNALIDTGEYTFEITLENYKSIQGELTITNSQYYMERHTLEPFVAKLQLFSRPTGAQVWINDEKRPEITPAIINLPPGEYSIGLYVPGFMIDERAVELKPNTTHDINATLKKGNMPLGMVAVPAGEFIFGDANKSPDEKPLRKIEVAAFYIDKYEVTNAEFQKVFPGHEYTERHDRYPVRGVTWKQASDYATAVGKRLPTEIEWEKAARGTKGNEFPWGAVFREELANTSVNFSTDTKIVGNYKKNASVYGCYDMAGNVYEWVRDWYNPYPGNPEVRVDYGTVYKVLRGGSFRSDAFEARSAKRHYDKPDAKREDYGFRCAQDTDL